MSSPRIGALSAAILLGGAAAAIAAVTAAAVAAADDSVTTVAPIVVTATRTAETADETLAPVSVVTREDIERLQAHSLEDVLRGLPGVAIANNGGRGKQASLFLRGAESDHVVVLVDGVRANAATHGGFGFGHVPIEQVERIEVVRGPRASLYGADAIGGVVQIFTRKGGGEPAAHGRLTVGSRRTVDATAGVSGGNERGWFHLTGSSVGERGFDACEEGAASFGCYKPSEPDDDGYRNRAVSLRAGYRFGGGAELEAHALHGRSDLEFDGSMQNESEIEQETYGSRLTVSPRTGWRSTLTLGHNHEGSDNALDGAPESRIATRRNEAALQNDVEIGEAHLLTVGLDYRRDRVSGTNGYTVKERSNRGGFAQVLATFGDHEAQLAVRRDDNEQFGGADTGGIAWGWQFHDGVRLTASYGTAFKAPTFDELYWPDFGNPDLDPEKSKTADLGLAGRHGATRWSMNVFRSKVENLIAYNADIGLPDNVSLARIRGLEASLGTRASGFDAAVSLTLLNPRNRGPGDAYGNDLARRPRRSLRLDIDRKADRRLGFGATVHAESGRYDDLGNTRRLGGFYTVDLRTGYRVSGDWSVQGRIENLFDRDYETAAGFNQPGRGVFVTLRYRP